MNACCANPACQSFMFYKSECLLYSVATSAGMDDILWHESRQGPWGIDAGGPGYSIAFWTMSRQPSQQIVYVKVSGDSSCAAEGYAEYTDATGGTAQGCRAAAESVGYDFSDQYSQLHAIPVQHNANGEHRSCVACENMIYTGRPTLLFFDRQSSAANPNQCDQNGEQTKFHICKETPTAIPSSLPTEMPTANPSPLPTEIPSPSPTEEPSQSPSRHPSTSPTGNPSASPTKDPSLNPTVNPSLAPTSQPSASPTKNPSTSPTRNPSASPTEHPSLNPTANPSLTPTGHPSASPTKNPSTSPTRNPSASPTKDPSLTPTANPSLTPTGHPSASPTEHPSPNPSVNPSFAPTNAPTYPPFLIHRGAHFWGANIGECGIFKSQAEIEQACNENPQCVGYSMADPAGWGGRRPDAQPDAKGFYPWCLKSSEAKDGCEDIHHDYYQKRDDNGSQDCTDNCVSTPGWTIDSNPVTTCGWMEHICGPMRRGECLEHGGNVKCQWGYVTGNHWANYGPYGSPVSHCCNCKGFQMPENYADSYWTTAPASWVWNGNWKNTHTSTGAELPICDPTNAPTETPTPSPTKAPTETPTTSPVDVCTLGTMIAGGIGDSSAELDRKYFKFDDQTAYDDYASAGSQYWHNGLGRTTYVSQTSLWPEGCMNACCANPACQSFMFYKSECLLYSVATSAGMDNILWHESRQGPWGINAGGPGYSIAFWEMSRQPSPSRRNLTGRLLLEANIN